MAIFFNIRSSRNEPEPMIRAPDAEKKNVQLSANPKSWPSRMRNCRRLRKTKVPESVTVDKSEKVAILQAPGANRKIELLTVTHSGTLVFRKRRQLRTLRCHEAVGDLDHD